MTGQAPVGRLERAKILENRVASTERISRLSTQDPEIASMLQGEEDWLDELVQGSVPCAAEVPTSKLTSRHPTIAAMLHAEDEWLQELVSRSVVTGPAPCGEECTRKTKEERKKEADERRRNAAKFVLRRNAAKFVSVSHNKSQFTKKIRKTNGVRLAGTQQIDRVWFHVKKSIPKTLNNRKLAI